MAVPYTEPTLQVEPLEPPPMRLEAKAIKIVKFKHSEMVTADYEAVSLQTFAKMREEGWAAEMETSDNMFLVTRLVPIEFVINGSPDADVPDTKETEAYFKPDKSERAFNELCKAIGISWGVKWHPGLASKTSDEIKDLATAIVKDRDIPKIISRYMFLRSTSDVTTQADWRDLADTKTEPEFDQFVDKLMKAHGRHD
jgi:hypothetical protein